MSSTLFHLTLAMTDGLGPVTITRLLARLGSAERAVAAAPAELRGVDGIGPSRARSIGEALKSAAASAADEMKRIADAGLSLLCLDSPDYPPLLKLISDPPVVLYVRGGLQPRDLNAVAVVGSRKCSFYGREQAERLGALLAGAGVTIVSGGARGTDSAAHRGALQHALGRTVAVLGSGLDVPYPPENEPLFGQIAARGAVLSEYPLGTPPLKENFPRRNRIVSGMSRAVLVTEADIKSGALITARLAADDHNRPVLAIPGRVDNPLSAGPHQLIRDGASLVTGLDDILAALGPLPADVALPDAPPLFAAAAADDADTPAAAEVAAPVGLTADQSAILAAAAEDPVAVDAIIDATGLSAPAVLRDLTLLSLRGLIRRQGPLYAARRP